MVTMGDLRMLSDKIILKKTAIKQLNQFIIRFFPNLIHASRCGIHQKRGFHRFTHDFNAPN